MTGKRVPIVSLLCLSALLAVASPVGAESSKKMPGTSGGFIQ